MALAAPHLLAAICPAFLAAQRRLDRLAAEHRGAGVVRAPGLGAGQGAKDVEQLLPGATLVPVLEVVVHRPPRREVVRQGPPGASLARMVEQRVDDLTQIDLPRPAGSPPTLDSGQQRLDQGPLLVRHVARIGFTLHTSFYAKPPLWNRLLTTLA